MRVIMLVLLLVGLSGAAGAAFKSGNDLHTQCIDESEALKMMSFAYCIGYITAVADVISDYAKSQGRNCFPPMVTGEQIVDVVKKWLETHPELRHYSAAWGVTRAFSEAFPCK